MLKHILQHLRLSNLDAVGLVDGNDVWPIANTTTATFVAAADPYSTWQGHWNKALITDTNWRVNTEIQASFS